MMELRKFVAPEFIFGVGAMGLVGRYLSNFGAKKVLVVSDQRVIDAGWTGKIVDLLTKEGIAVCRFCRYFRQSPRY